MSAETDRRIRAGWMSFNRYRVELYDRPTASLDLKTRMVKSEVVEALLYGCAAWTPLKGDYQKLRTEHHRMLPRQIMVGTLENPGRRGRGGKEKEWTDFVADDLRLFGIEDGEGWKTAASEPSK